MAPNPEDRLSGTDGVSGADGLEFEPVETKPKTKRHWGRWVSFAVVVVVGAGGGWYYFGDRLLPMNQEKSVPLIRADITPVKIKPADPGGMEVPDRDKLVYDRLKGEGAGTNVERLLPPPETPIPIPEDQLQGSTTETDVAMQPPPEPLVPESTTVSDTMAAQTTEANSEMTAAMAESSQSSETAPVPLEPVATEPTAQAQTQIPAAPEAPPPPPVPVEPVETAAVTPTPLEPAQPDVEPATQTAAEAITQTSQVTTTVDTSEVTLQTQEVASTLTAQTKEFRIQLAALRTHERAETEWKRQKKAHPDILGSLKSFIVRVDLGEDKGVFFRLRAGPLKDSKSAKALCGELAKRNVGCLVIRPGK